MVDAKEAQLRQAPLVVVRLCPGDSNIHVRISLELADACGVPAQHVLDYIVPVVDEQAEARSEKRLRQAPGQPEAQHIWLEAPSHSWDHTGHKLTSSATIAITTQVKTYGVWYRCQHTIYRRRCKHPAVSCYPSYLLKYPACNEADVHTPYGINMQG